MNFTPVIMGANRGSYSLARAFYEKYGVKTIIISPFQTGPVRNSRILEFYYQVDMQDFTALTCTMAAIQKDYPETQKIIFGSDDRYVELLIKNRTHFSSKWVVPYSDYESYISVVDKTNFSNLCEQLDILHPRTVVLRESESFELAYPVIIKAAQTTEYHNLDFEGKNKVYICQHEEEAATIISRIRQAGYTSDLLVQEYIPGDDTHLGIVTVYVSQKDLQIKLFSYANVLVDDPTPSAIGNSLAGWVREEKQVEEPISRMIAATGFYGFATFDVKYDARRNDYVFFEMNGRLGLSNYYVTAAGHNVAAYYIEDFLLKKELSFAPFKKEIIYSALTNHLLEHRVEFPKLRTMPVVHPLVAAYETNWLRKWYIAISKLNFYRKLWKYKSLEGKVKPIETKYTSFNPKILHTKKL